MDTLITQFRDKQAIRKKIRDAAQLIKKADRIVVLAGAGMGVDSGLPDFRGPEGLWRAYPALKGRQFEELASNQLFHTDPTLAWGFYGHRLNLYRATEPHEGFHILRRWMDAKPKLGFVFTSNVDGAFLKAGFAEDRVHEIHGSIHFLQCSRRDCNYGLTSADAFIPVVSDQLRADAPRCHCGAFLRPNILMFNDGAFEWSRTEEQEDRYRDFLDHNDLSSTVLIEIGAGKDLPSVMRETGFLSKRALGVIEINPGRILRESCEGVDHWIGLPLGGLHALTEIDKIIT
jgi:NAD-dependent SIR2 family protein deacetylase